MNRSNEDWLAHLGTGGPEQQAALRDLRRGLLRGLRRALAGRSQVDDAFCDDMVQEALLRILDRLPQFEGRSRFVTWATSIAIRVAMTELRRRRWKDVSLESLLAAGADPALQAATWDDPRPTLAPERHALVGKMYEVIRHELTGRQRTALLAELKGMPQSEIARQLGSNRNAVYKLTHDARKRLKRSLEAAGYRGDDVQSAFTV